ncbi:hypothetical protein D9M71_312160 [compost metagenome]
MRLRRQVHRHAGPVLLGLLKGLFHQFMAKSLTARRRCADYPANHHIATLGLRIEQSQVGMQFVVLPGHQVVGIAFQVPAIDLLIGTLLFHDEDFGAQSQNGIELFLANVTVVFADPVDSHGRLSSG